MPLVLSGTTGISTNGTTWALNPDNAGRVTMPNQPAFMARPSLDNWFGTVGTLPFNITDLNKGSHYNTSLHRFTAPITGLYQFYVHLLIRGNVTGRISIRKNASIQYEIGHTSASASTEYNRSSASVIFELVANDFVDTHFDVVTGDGVVFMGNTAIASNVFSYWGGHLIG
jgi:hypothetical protein